MLSSSNKETNKNPLTGKHDKVGLSSSGKDKHHHRHTYLEPTPIYLDQLVSAPHFPRPEGALPPTSKVIMPDLQRTGIRSRYSKDWPTQPFDIAGRITNEFLAETSSTMKAVPEPNLPLFYKELRANQNHRVNLSRTLIEFEDKREERYQIMRRDLRNRVKSIGFTNIDSASMCLSPLALTHSLKSQRNDMPSLRYARAQSMSPLKGQDTAGATTTTHNNGNPHSKSEKSPSHHLTSSSSSNPNPKVYSRINFFKECLASSEPPKTFRKKRFGVLGRKTTMPSLLTPTTLSARESNNGDDENEEEYGDDTVEYKDEGDTRDDQRRIGGMGEEEETYQDDQEFDEEPGPLNPRIDHHDPSTSQTGEELSFK